MLKQKVTDYLTSYAKQWPFHGTVLIAKEGNILFEQSYGYANLEHLIQIHSNTVFKGWSLTKSFTATAIQQLIEQQKLTLDTSIAQFFPEFSQYEAITIDQLLHHRSGLMNYTSITEYNERLNSSYMSKADFINMICQYPLQSTPGSVFSYNNTGYYLLSLIIEIVAGMTYEDYIQTYICQPIGLEFSGIDCGTQLIANLAAPYQAHKQSYIAAQYVHMSSIKGAGALYTTAHDLLKWNEAIYAGKLIELSKINDLLYSDSPYELGWFKDRYCDELRHYHSGAYRGYKSELHRLPALGYVVIVLSNIECVPTTSIAEALLQIIIREENNVPMNGQEIEALVPNKLQQSLTVEDIQRITGLYKGYGVHASISFAKDQLTVLWDHRYEWKLHKVAEGKFRHEWCDQVFNFKQLDDGSIRFHGLTKQL